MATITTRTKAGIAAAAALAAALLAPATAQAAPVSHDARLAVSSPVTGARLAGADPFARTVVVLPAGRVAARLA